MMKEDAEEAGEQDESSALPCLSQNDFLTTLALILANARIHGLGGGFDPEQASEFFTVDQVKLHSRRAGNLQRGAGHSDAMVCRHTPRRGIRNRLLLCFRRAPPTDFSGGQLLSGAGSGSAVGHRRRR